MIYFIKSDSGHVKIGHTVNDINERLNMLRVGNPYKLSVLKTLDFPFEQESLIHEKFKNDRCEGEWFELTDEILQFINSPYSIKTKLPIKNRQQKWQKEKQKQGLCSICGKYPLAPNSEYRCEICLLKRRMAYKKGK